MRRVKLLQPVGLHKKGETVQLENNEAHALIEQGKAVLVYQDKMIHSEQIKKGKHA